MNDMNDLERILASWAPRHPSARIKQGLFGRAAEAAPNSCARAEESGEAPRQPAFRFQWFAPATAAALLVLLLNQQHASTVQPAYSSSPLLAMIVSNQSAAAYLPGSFDRRQNDLRPQSFEWTNGSSSTSSITSLSGSRGTNDND